METLRQTTVSGLSLAATPACALGTQQTWINPDITSNLLHGL